MASKRWTGLRFGENLKLERERRGWTQEQLAQKLREAGIQSHWSTVSKIENGERSVRVDEAAAIADLFDGMSIDALVGRDPNPEADSYYILQKAHQLVQQGLFDNHRLALGLRELVQPLTPEAPKKAVELAKVADAIENIAEVAARFLSDGPIFASKLKGFPATEAPQ